ncbi:MAG TPA: hypothetical protein VF144_17625 [Chitinophagaceae bacterium]
MLHRLIIPCLQSVSSQGKQPAIVNRMSNGDKAAAIGACNKKFSNKRLF